MKKICSRLFLAVALMMSTFVASCSSSNDPQNEPQSFPEELSLNIDAGQDYQLSFNAYANWKLTSTTTWCKIVDKGVEVYDVSGTSGKQSVTIRITDDGQTFEESKAELKLNMGGTEKRIATIIRNAKNYNVQILDADGNELKELVISNSEYTTFTVKTNFEYTTNEIQQVEFNKVPAGEGNKELVTGAIIKDNYLTHPITKADGINLTFINVKGDVIATYPIIYNGIDENFIKVKDNDVYQWLVSLDGKTFQQGFGKYDPVTKTTSGTTSVSSQISYSVVALNDKYKFIFIEADEQGNINRPSNEWIHATQDTKDAGKVNVTADASTSYRTGCVLVFSDAAYNKANSDIQTGGNYQKIKNAYKNNILTELSQQDDNAPFDIRDGVNDWNRLHTYTLSTDKSDLKESFNVNTDKVYVMYANVGTSLIIFPKYRETSKENKTVYKSYAIFKTDGTEDSEMMDIKNNLTEETFYDDWYMFYVNIRRVPENRDAFYVVFYTADGTNEKVLKVVAKK